MPQAVIVVVLFTVELVIGLKFCQNAAARYAATLPAGTVKLQADWFTPPKTELSIVMGVVALQMTEVKPKQ